MPPNFTLPIVFFFVSLCHAKLYLIQWGTNLFSFTFKDPKLVWKTCGSGRRQREEAWLLCPLVTGRRKRHLEKQVVLAIELIILISKKTRYFRGNRLPISFKTSNSQRTVESSLQQEAWGQLSPGWGEAWGTCVLSRMWQFWQALSSPASEIRWDLAVTDGRD